MGHAPTGLGRSDILVIKITLVLVSVSFQLNHFRFHVLLVPENHFIYSFSFRQLTPFILVPVLITKISTGRCFNG